MTFFICLLLFVLTIFIALLGLRLVIQIAVDLARLPHGFFDDD